MAKLFSTRFPVNPDKTIDDLASTVRDWIIYSPHKQVSRKDLELLGNDGFEYAKKETQISSLRLDDKKEEMYGTRIIERDRERIYLTDIVGHKGPAKFEVSVSHDFRTSKIGSVKAHFKKPRIVNDILLSLGGGYDGDTLKTQTKAFWFDEDSLPFVADVINNGSDNELPVVYLSRDNRGFTVAHPDRLAFVLGGMAHVLVEPSRHFSYMLKDATKGRSAYAGAVGIYWPNGIWEYFTPDKARNIEQKLAEVFREFASWAVIPAKLSFEGLQSRQAKNRIETLKEKHASSDEILTHASKELSRKEKEVEELKEKLSAIGQRLARHQSGIRPVQGGILQVPQIAELYSGEAYELIIEAIKEHRDRVPPDSRRKETLDAILSQNTVDRQREQILGEIKKLFRGNPAFSAAIRNKLIGLGFEVKEEGKHVKVRVPGNDRYSVTIARTPSDHRAGRNVIRDFKRII